MPARFADGSKLPTTLRFALIHSWAMKKFVFLVLAFLAVLVSLQLARLLFAPGEAATEGPKIVSMAPNLTGILFGLGLGDRVVGVTTYCDYPAAALEVEKIGDFINPNFERIIRLRPDLVIAERWGSSKTSWRLRQLGLRVVEVPTPQSLLEIYTLIRSVGELTGRAVEAEVLVKGMKGRVEEIKYRAARFPLRPKLFLEIDRPTWTVGKASFTNEAIALCGARNIFDDLSRPAPQVSQEEVIRRDPDIVVSFVASAEEIMHRPGWNRISAVREGRVVDDFSQSLLSQGNQRLVEGIEALQERVRDLMKFEESTAGPRLEDSSRQDTKTHQSY